MYVGIKDAMMDCKIAGPHSEPVWMDKEGAVVNENSDKKFGNKVDLNILRPDLCLVADEVGCNTCMKGDGHVGGKKLVCERGCVPYETIGKKDKHFTVLGFTNLLGDPILCVIIITGKEEDLSVRLGIVDDDDVVAVGSIDDENFVSNNTREGMKFPGGPRCCYKGKSIPSYVTFAESGGMSGKILTEVLMHLDALSIYDDDRQNGYTPMLLVDGHDSRFDVEFLKYINDDKHKWAVCIGVPYGTSYWQVGDSKEQNGTFKMKLPALKIELMRKRMTHHVSDLQILPTDIIPLVNEAWKLSFGRQSTNKVAIAERGWFPYNYNLLLHPDIRNSMTEKEIQEERESSSGNLSETTIRNGSSIFASSTDTILSDITCDTSMPLLAPPVVVNFNYSKGSAASFLTTMVSEHDITLARERNIENIKKGKEQREELKKIKGRIKAGGSVKAGYHRLGVDIRDEQIERQMATKQKEIDAKNKKISAYRAKVLKAQSVHQKYGTDVNKMKVEDLKAIVMPLKRKSDPKVESKRDLLIQQWNKWKHRSYLCYDDKIGGETNIVSESTNSRVGAIDLSQHNQISTITAQPNVSDINKDASPLSLSSSSTSLLLNQNGNIAPNNINTKSNPVMTNSQERSSIMRLTSSQDGNIASSNQYSPNKSSLAITSPISGVFVLNCQKEINTSRTTSSNVLGQHEQNGQDSDVDELEAMGLSKMLDESKDKLQKGFAGTPAFMAPEVCVGESFNGKIADLYSVGATTFYIRFKKLPFVGRNLVELYTRIQNDKAYFPFSVAKGLEEIMNGLMVKIPSDRLTMAELLVFPWLQQRPGENNNCNDQRTNEMSTKYGKVKVSETEIYNSIKYLNNI